MNLFLPLGYLLFGLLFSSKLDNFKFLLAKILAKIFIPVVIVYNVIYYKQEYLALMVFSFLSSLLLYFIYKITKKNALKALCFSYSNIG